MKGRISMCVPSVDWVLVPLLLLTIWSVDGYALLEGRRQVTRYRRIASSGHGSDGHGQYPS